MAKILSQKEIADLIIHEIQICVPNLESEQISFEKGFLEMGIESLQAVNIIDGIAQKLNISLDVTALFDKPNLNKLSEYLYQTLNKNFSETKIDLSSSKDNQVAQMRHKESIAIVGMSCKFPGAEDLNSYYELLDKGQCAVSKQSHQRWQSDPEDSINNFGAIEDYDLFPADVFGITDHEAQRMDPQQRLLLMEVWKALEDSGISPHSVRGSQTGVYVGISSHDYSYLVDTIEKTDIFSVTGNSQSISANRISYFFDLHGPSFAVDTACSSSLVALDAAVRALQNNEIEMAIVAGVNLILKSDLSQAFKGATMLSPDGLCKSFSADANGYVRGEGVGVLILKRFSEAEREGYRSYAQILSVAVNQDGKSSSLTAPNGSAQEAVLLEGLRRAGIRYSDVKFHEAHGTGTPVGDPIEALAIERVHQGRDFNDSLLVSSVKTNIGHLEAAAGIAGIVKVALSIYYRKVFKNLHFKKINSLLENKIPHLKIVTESHFFSDNIKLIGSVSSFGFGGTNAHAILSEIKNQEKKKEPLKENSLTSISKYAVGGFSSNDRGAIFKNIKNLKKRIKNFEWDEIKKYLPATLNQRMNLKEQVTFYAESKEDLFKTLDFLAQNIPNEKYQWGTFQKINSSVAMIFTGQGSQYTGMYKELYQSDNEIKTTVDYILFRAQKYFPKNLFQVWLDPELESELSQTNYAQILLFAFEFSIAQQLIKTYGFRVDLLFGHSLGEIIAAVVGEVLSLDNGIELVCRRGLLMRHTSEGAMLAVFAPLEKTLQLTKLLNLDLAANNGPQLQIVSGAVNSIKSLQEILSEQSIRHQRLSVNQAFHSALMDEILEKFQESISNLSYQKSSIPIVSSLCGTLIDNNQIMSAPYWKQQLRNTTQFEKAVKSLASMGIRTYVEIGPKPTLIRMAQNFINEKNTKWISLFEPKNNSLDVWVKGLLQLTQLNHFQKSPWISNKKEILPASIMKKNKYWLFGGSMENKTNPPNEEILEKLVDILAGVMRVSVDEISVDESLIDLGADSLVLMNAVQIIKDTYQVAIPIADVFKDLNTLRKISIYISKEKQTMNLKPTSISNSGSTLASLRHSVVLPKNKLMNLNSSQGGSGDLISLFNNQLVLLQNQLNLLSGVTSISSEHQMQMDGLEKEKRGVLGNFRSFVSSEKTEEDNLTKKEFLDKTIRSVSQLTPKTKKHVQKYRRFLADNRVSAGFRPNTKEMIYPIHCHKAKGSYFEDIDGNKFIDFTMGFGVNLFGHSPDFIDQAMKDQFDLGVCVGPQSYLAGEVAQLFCELTGSERVAFLNSGTEAVMTALRLARAATKKNKIVIFDGSYHGHFDGVLAKGAKSLTSTPVAAGITQNMVNDVTVLEYGNPKSLEVIHSRAHELAAVLVEPVQSRFPELQPKEFLQDIRKITEENNVAFIWDEVITGFRVAPGGAQEYFGIKADLASYGKILGGGMPIGAVGGNKKYLDFIDGGYWEFGDESFPQNEMTFFAGTFCKHPLTMATALATLKKVKSDGHQMIQKLNLLTSELVEQLNLVFSSRGLEIKVFNFGTLFRFKGNLNLDLLFIKLLEKGIYIWEGRNCFLSTAHTDEDLKYFVKAVAESCEELQAAKFYPGRDLNAHEKLKLYEMTPYQNRFLKLEKKGDSSRRANNICVSAKVKGFLDVSKLQKAIEIIIQNRDIFQWSYSKESDKQYFSKNVKPLHFEFINLRSIERPWKILDKQLLELSETQFDLEAQSPMLIKIFDVVEETYLLAIIAHHMAFDGWSMTLFFEDLASAYNALLKGEKVLLRSSYGFSKYLEQKPEISINMEESLIHKYMGADPAMLFRDKSSDESRDYSGQRIVFDIEMKVFEALKQWGKQNKMTPFMILLAAFARTLMKEFKKTNLTIGIPAANRDILGTEIMYGNCANLVPVTLEGEEVSILKFVQQVKMKMIEGYQSMSYPYELLREKTGELFDVYFNLEPTSDLPEFDEASLIIHPFSISSSEFPLMLNITDFEHYYHCEMDFQISKINDDRVLKIIDQLRSALKSELVINLENIR